VAQARGRVLGERHLSADAPAETRQPIRTALIERIRAIARRDQRVVIYSCGAASPDGTLWAFGKGRCDCARAFCCRGRVDGRVFWQTGSARRFVTAKVQEAPRLLPIRCRSLVFRLFHGYHLAFWLVSMLGRLCRRGVVVAHLEDTAISSLATLITLGYLSSVRVAAGMWRHDPWSPFLTQNYPYSGVQRPRCQTPASLAVDDGQPRPLARSWFGYGSESWD